MKQFKLYEPRQNYLLRPLPRDWLPSDHKVKAYASKHAAMSYARMVKEEQRLREEIEAYFEETETTDQQEDQAERDGTQLPDHLQTAKQRLNAIREAKQALEEEAREKACAEQQKRRAKAEQEGRPYQPRSKAQRNFTDPESRNHEER